MDCKEESCCPTKAESIKSIIRASYTDVATKDPGRNAGSCCGVGKSCSKVDYSIFSEDYSQKPGYVASADLKLGCGMPVSFARIGPGDTVVDFGSGAGNDAFVARAITGVSGQVIGIDFTNAMVEKATANAKKAQLSNVEFRLGDIEKVPVESNVVDVVISNCVFNLVPNKRKAFSEVERILKPGGHFCISDVVLKGGNLPENIRKASEMYAGCVAGALQKSEFLFIIHELNFESVSVVAEKKIAIPEEILAGYLSPKEIEDFLNSGAGIYSVTVRGTKPKQ